MVLKMKRVFSALLMSTLFANVFAVHKEFLEGYELIPSKASTKVKELPMSLYKDGTVVFFRGDSAYIAKISDSYELEDVKVCEELCGLGIEGTFAYDQRRRTYILRRRTRSETRTCTKLVSWRGLTDCLRNWTLRVLERSESL
jgi:hypothetical protein